MRTIVRPNRGPIERLIDRYSAPYAQRLYRRADGVAKLPFRKEVIEPPPPVIVDGRAIDVIDDLVAFTQLPREQILHEVQTRTAVSFRSEWWATPPEWRFDHWYYLGSKGYLFANASHFPDDDFVQEFASPHAKTGDRVFDFGAGSGNLTILLAPPGKRPGPPSSARCSVTSSPSAPSATASPTGSTSWTGGASCRSAPSTSGWRWT